MKQSELTNIRDTIQSIWVAIILAFALRAFIVEAFEIPTGSMAPRLMGMHVQVTCPECKYQFPRGLSQIPSPRPDNSAWCPNCGEKTNIKRQDAQGGDRVLVLKLPAGLRPLKRWDVVVFKDVQGNQQNYIKRLIGLPGQVIRIVHGDVFYHTIKDVNGDQVYDERDLPLNAQQEVDWDSLQWSVARKPGRTQDAMWQLLFDNDYQPANGRMRRQQPWRPLWAVDPAATGWRIDLDHGRVFQFDGSQPGQLHFARARGQRDIFLPANPYNSRPENEAARSPGVHCSDLKLETTLQPESEAGALRLRLSSHRSEFAGEFHFDGRVRLLHRAGSPNGQGDSERWDAAEGSATNVPALAAGRPVRIAMTHADWQVTLWVDGEAVLTYDRQPSLGTLLADGYGSDRRPPRVGIMGMAGEFKLWHTRVFRDVFYTCPNFPGPRQKDRSAELRREYGRKNFPNETRPGQPAWGTQGSPLVLRKHADQPDYDEFFMLGDNSPASSDSRLWLEASPTLRLYDHLGAPRYRLGTVPRYNLIGKAFFVYWPAGSPLPGVGLPLVPNVGKMRRIH